MPPTGGYGGNTGVHDAQPSPETGPCARRSGGESLWTPTGRAPAGVPPDRGAGLHAVRDPVDPGLGTDNLAPVVDDVIDLGYRYRSDSFSSDGTDDDADWEDPRTPTGRPGFRAPHVTVHRDGAEVSALDLVGRDPVLVVGPDGAPWADAADRLGVLIAVLRLGTEVEDPHGEFAKAYGIGPDGAVLIRGRLRGVAQPGRHRPGRRARGGRRRGRPDARPSLTRLGVGRVTLLNTRCLPGVPA